MCMRQGGNASGIQVSAFVDKHMTSAGGGFGSVHTSVDDVSTTTPGNACVGGEKVTFGEEASLS